MNSLTSAERRGKALIISTATLVAILFLFLSYLVAVQHRLQRMQDIYYGAIDTLCVDSTICQHVANQAAYIDTVETFTEIPDNQNYLDEVVVKTIDNILGNISFFETVTYFLIFLCVFVLGYVVISIISEQLQTRRKSSLADLPEERAQIINEYVLDPVGLCQVIDKRISQAKNKRDKSDWFALDYVYLSRKEILKPRTKSAYQKAFLESLIGNSQFSDKVNEIEDILDNEKLPDSLDYRKKYSEIDMVYKRFNVLRKNFTADNTGNSPENDRKSE